jgi:hypothetical protein
MKLFKVILFAYGFIFSYFLFLAGIRNFRTLPDLLLILIIAPVTLFFIVSIVKGLKFFSKINHERLFSVLQGLKYFSLVNSLLLFSIAVYGSIFHFEFAFILMIVPLPLFFTLTVFGNRENEISEVIEEKVERKKFSLKTFQENEKLKEGSVGEPMRRKFIKILGGAGIGFLLMSLINPRKAEASFFGSVPGPGTVSIKDSTGAKIDPAIKSPTDAYGISQIADTTPAYYGFVNKSGAWYITREEEDGSYRYFKGLTDFATNWANRNILSYDYFNTTFAA